MAQPAVFSLKIKFLLLVILPVALITASLALPFNRELDSICPAPGAEPPQHDADGKKSRVKAIRRFGSGGDKAYL